MVTKLAVIIVTALSLPALTDPSKPEEKPVEKPAQMEGFWLSPKLMDLVLRRVAQDVGERYELDTARRTKVEEVVVKRWSSFFNENRAQIQPLANEFIELRMELKPPPKDRVQDWAKRAMPVFERFRSQINDSSAEIRELLEPLNRAKFDLEAMAFAAGMTLAEHKLKKWESGEFEARDFWMPTPAERRKMREERRRQRAAREGKPIVEESEQVEEDQIALELSGWDKYVEEFIRLYDIDEAQRTTALSCLSELKQRAAAHRDLRREDIAKLEKRIKNHTGSKEDLAEIKKQLSELYGPIDDMFKELKGRLAQIPTAEQRAKVAEPKEDG